jgi:hypothetical protein
MMQHLLKVKKEQVRPPFVIELEELLAGRLDGPVDVTTATVGDRQQMTLHMIVAAYADKQRVARAATPIVWRQIAGKPGEPDTLVFAITKKGETVPLEIEAERPPWVPAKAGGAADTAVTPPGRGTTDPPPSTPANK